MHPRVYSPLSFKFQSSPCYHPPPDTPTQNECSVQIQKCRPRLGRSPPADSRESTALLRGRQLCEHGVGESTSHCWKCRHSCDPGLPGSVAGAEPIFCATILNPHGPGAWFTGQPECTGAQPGEGREHGNSACHSTEDVIYSPYLYLAGLLSQRTRS